MAEVHPARRMAGCYQCRIVREVCDDERPSCGRCVRLEQECEFSRLPQRPPRMPITRLTASDLPVDTHTLQPMDVLDMFLLRSFMVNCENIVPDKDDQDVFDEEHDPTYLAFQQQYLLHAILGLSALHHYCTVPDPDPAMLRVAIRHHDDGIRLARPHLVRVDPLQAEALYWFTIYSSLFSLAQIMIRPSTQEAPIDYVEELLTIFRLFRATKLSLPHMDPDYYLRHMNSTIYFTEEHEGLKARVEQDFAELPQFRDMARDSAISGLTEEEADCCIAAADSLFLIVAMMQWQPDDKEYSMMLLTWAMELSDTFIDLCRQKQPMAMVLMCWYALAIRARDEMWFLEGWAEALYRDCEILVRQSTIDESFYLSFPQSLIVMVDEWRAQPDPDNPTDIRDPQPPSRIQITILPDPPPMLPQSRQLNGATSHLSTVPEAPETSSQAGQPSEIAPQLVISAPETDDGGQVHAASMRDLGSSPTLPNGDHERLTRSF